MTRVVFGESSGIAKSERANLSSIARHVSRLLGIKNSIVYLFFLPAADMKRLTSRFYDIRPKGAVADVLAFPESRDFPHPEMRKKSLGEIYVNRSAAKLPRYRGRTITETRAFLFVHGFLHLIGFEHDRKSDMLQMERVEKSVLEKFGFLKRGLP